MVACLESDVWGDYRSGTERDNGYRATGGRRPQVQFDHEKAVIDSLGKKGLMVAYEARVNPAPLDRCSTSTGRARIAAAS